MRRKLDRLIMQIACKSLSYTDSILGIGYSGFIFSKQLRVQFTGSFSKSVLYGISSILNVDNGVSTNQNVY